MTTSHWAVVSGLVVLIAFGFLGSRGLWEPDEGRYVQAAREMTLAGDYLSPTLNRIPHFTKPPLTYWTVAAGLRAIGPSEWGARIRLWPSPRATQGAPATIRVGAPTRRGQPALRSGWSCGSRPFWVCVS